VLPVIRGSSPLADSEVVLDDTLDDVFVQLVGSLLPGAVGPHPGNRIPTTFREGGKRGVLNANRWQPTAYSSRLLASS